MIIYESNFSKLMDFFRGKTHYYSPVKHIMLTSVNIPEKNYNIRYK